jgi:hypothetical protein
LNGPQETVQNVNAKKEIAIENVPSTSKGPTVKFSIVDDADLSDVQESSSDFLEETQQNISNENYLLGQLVDGENQTSRHSTHHIWQKIYELPLLSMFLRLKLRSQKN